MVVSYSVFYADINTDPDLKQGWYFWFLDEQENVVSKPIGPWETSDEAEHSGTVAVRTYYDDEDESGSGGDARLQQLIAALVLYIEQDECVCELCDIPHCHRCMYCIARYALQANGYEVQS